MRYIIAAQIYWPVWLLSSAQGHPYIGMLAGAASVVALWFVLWRVQWGTWKLGK